MFVFYFLVLLCFSQYEHDCDTKKTYNATGLKISIICTSHDKLGAENCTDFMPTGIASKTTAFFFETNSL